MAEKDICVRVQGVSKKFSRSLKRSFVYGARDIGRALLGRKASAQLRPSEFWAVRDVSFELRKGDAISIVGLNGSGKTTLLRMISGILQPTMGRIEVVGRIAPMLALGAGFKPVLSGRENIYLNLSLLGVSEQEIRKRFDAIVDFAELQDSINAPLGTYSSGMRSRLGFACAVHTDPGILVVDEVLSVGDARFRVKCRNKINELRNQGSAMLLVSHSAILVETLSTECLYLHKGGIKAKGNPREVLDVYEKDIILHAQRRNEEKLDGQSERPFEPGRLLQIRSVRIGKNLDSDMGYWQSSESGELTILLDAAEELQDISVNLLVFDLTHQPGQTVQFMMSSRDVGWWAIPQGSASIRLVLPQVGLVAGTYRLKLSVSRGGSHEILDVVDDVRLIVRNSSKSANCLYYQPRLWSSEQALIASPPEELEEEDILADE